ncbi:putative integral membrane protein [Rosellinia necatrix]|uniref:Putative integral membrane protein n=1 Tax=Rosellinia necatrix TaxID=77044 RepID=A0A1W2TVX4_ROSNE|nr:putative integral membrane protein [Rosellinia necatrix]
MQLPVDPESLPHDNRAHVLIIVVVVVLSIASISVGLRIYTRAYLLKQIGLDDYLSLLALLMAFATGVSQCINTRNGLGKHSWDLKAPEEVVSYLKNFYVNIVFYNTGLLVVKLAFLTQYYRVLAVGRFRTVCLVAMVVVGAWGLSQILIGIFICTPVAGFWDATLNPTCIPVPLQWYINAAGNITSDIVVFVLPLPVLTHLQLPKAQRLTLVGIFSLGFFTCAISVVRIKFLKQGGDFSYENIEASSWSIAELSSGVTCVCLPTLRPFVSKYIPKLASKVQISSAGCVRNSGSEGINAGKASRHTRNGSRENNGLRSGSEDELYRPDAPPDSDLRTSGETLDVIIGLHRDKESLSGSGSVAPLNLNLRGAPPRDHITSNTLAGWTQPSITTTISTGNGPSRAFGGHSSTIHVTHDIMMQQLTPRKV